MRDIQIIKMKIQEQMSEHETEKGKLLGPDGKNSFKGEESETIIRKSWQYEVYGFLLGLFASFLMSFSATCIRSMNLAVPDIEVRKVSPIF